MSTISKILKEHSKKSGKPKHQSLQEEHGPRKRKMASSKNENVSDASILADIETIAPTLRALATKYTSHPRANLFFVEAFTSICMLRDEIKTKWKP